MKVRGLAPLVGVLAIVASDMVLESPSARAAGSCSSQYDVCFDACVKYGFGAGRKSNPHPQPPDVCRNHCVGWKSECMSTGCWNGDLYKACGLTKR